MEHFVLQREECVQFCIPSLMIIVSIPRQEGRGYYMCLEESSHIILEHIDKSKSTISEYTLFLKMCSRRTLLLLFHH